MPALAARPLEGRYPYLFLDAKVEKVRNGGHVVNKALVIAHGVHETGRREILSIDVGEAGPRRSGPSSSGTWPPAGSLASSWPSATRTPA